MSLAFPSVPSNGSLSPFLNSIVRLGIMARPERFELPTYGFVDHRSIQLSYGRAVLENTAN